MRIIRWIEHYSSLPSSIRLAMFISLSFFILRAWTPLEQLLPQTSDDAYYYLNIARNIALHRGVSFDGIFPTNGFHALYLIFVTPFYLFAPEKLELNLHLALTMLSVFYVLTAIPLYRLIDLTIGKTAAPIAVVSWLFNPWGLIIVMNGVESAVYTFFLACSALLFVRYQQTEPGKEPTRLPILMGFVSGLTLLARSDSIFLVIAILLTWLFRGFINLRDGKLKIYLRHVTLYCLCIFLVISFWVFWNFFNWGTINQISGKALFLHSHHMVRTIPEIALIVWANIQLVLRLSITINFLAVAFILSFLVFGLLPKAGLKQEIKPENKIFPAPLFFLGLYTGLIFFFYTFIFWHFQIWYFMPILLIFSIWLAKAFSNVVKRWKTFGSHQPQYLARFIQILFATTFLAYFLGVYPTAGMGNYQVIRNGLRIAKWLDQNTPVEARIAAWNSGVIGYFSHRTVINLDGVVNNELFKFLQKRGLEYYDEGAIQEYMFANRIEYITDIEGSIPENLIGGLSPVFNFSSAGNEAVKIMVYRVKFYP